MWRNWFRQKENIAVVGLALLVFGLHFIVINNPHKGRTLDDQGKIVEATGFNPRYHYEGEILDERHYVTEANSIIHDQKLLHPEHPSLGKLIISAGIRVLGDNAFGWRFFSVLFGTASIILFYLVCQKLTSRRYVPLLATFLFAFENSVFVQAGVAMLDVFLVTFMLAAFLLYLHHRYISSGVALA
jgi:dolichyl-phosphate-mannose--protein O-mannosyl transferase